MNIGNVILSLRKRKGITQEELAAELGVTAAAVSKWENGYTLPDILMLVALADYFEVTTDELLGRNKKQQKALIVTDTPEISKRLEALTRKHGLEIVDICATFAQARKLAEEDPEITLILISSRECNPEVEEFRPDDRVKTLECACEDQEKNLDMFEIMLNNMVKW